MDKQSVRQAPQFRMDIEDVLFWTAERFGFSAAQRYAGLIRQAISDLTLDPGRPAAKARPDLAPHAWIYHLSFSRTRVSGHRVARPRHFILYLRFQRRLEFARLLHDSSDLPKHVPPQDED